MSEMVEKVARALCAHGGFDPDGLEPGDAYGIDGYMHNGEPAHFFWRQFVAEARAAIEAMREPSEEMLWAGGEQIPNTLTDAEPIWQAMIDAALGKDQ